MICDIHNKFIVFVSGSIAHQCLQIFFYSENLRKQKTDIFLLFSANEVNSQALSNYIPFYEKPTYNCTIPRIIQGEWYSREKNLDTVTVIDAARSVHRLDYFFGGI